MVKADDSWFCRQHSSRQSPSLNNMGASLQPRQQESLPACINPCACMFSANMALPGFAASGLPGLKTGQTNEAHTQFQCLPPYFQTSHPTPNPYLKEKQSAFSYKLGGKATENSMSGSLLKRFLIFDQSGNQTRLMFSSVCSPARNPIIGPTNPVCAYDWREEEPAAKMDQVYPTKPIIHEESDENHISGEGSEMHEDTEEINALLYSDDDDDYGEDDEETSTGHSPFAFNANYEKQEQVEEITEEVASSDGPTKRHRLLDGGYNKSSLMDTASSVKPYTSCKYNNDAESSCAKGRTQGEEKGSILGNKRSRKDSIRETLGILENIIPGAKGKDSLSVLEEAINYLKSLEHKAKAVGANYH